MRTTAVALCLLMLASRGDAQEEATAHQVFGLDEKALAVDRAFYDGPLNWYYQANGASPSLSMRGYSSTPNGGVISRVTACAYNESAFDRTFRATASVVQGSSTLQSITFQRSFLDSRFSCHPLTDFNVTLAPGEFQIVVAYNLFDADNVFLGLPATDSGTAYDVQIGSARPPSATGPQGPIPIKGVGIAYRITENDSPPPPPPTCTPSDAALCLNNGRFKVEATFQAPGQPVGTAKVVKLTDETGYFWFFSSTNVELVVKVLNACGLNDTYWVFSAGLTNVRVDIKVTDTETGVAKTYTNPQGVKYVAVQDTAAFATCP
jgi:hypothetical protein